MQTDARRPAQDPAPPDIGGGLLHFWAHRSIRTLSPADRLKLDEAQVRATRPIVSGVVFSGGVILALVAVLQAMGRVPGIGYPWWLVALVAGAVAGCSIAIWFLGDWRPRLLLALLGTALTGVVMSVPAGPMDVDLGARTALFQLMPIALLAMFVRRTSIVALVLLCLGLAALRVSVHADAESGTALYWLHTLTALGFGLLLGQYRADFAVVVFRMRRRLQRQATTDGLTDLLNRAGWNELAEEAYSDAVRRGLQVSVAFFDIDHFKRVNDTHGHEAGDGVLRALGQILRHRLGTHSLAARLGGEEFVVLFVDEPAEAVEGFVQRVRRDFADGCEVGRTTVSVGVAHRLGGEALGAQLRRADLALYEAKETGRDRMVVARAPVDALP